MADRDRGKIRLHEDEPLFGEAIAFTAATTGFNGRIIEKDYFCTVLLEDLARDAASGIVFKGGTCLAKVHAGFYRLSEDLDFAIVRDAMSRSATSTTSITRSGGVRSTWQPRSSQRS